MTTTSMLETPAIERTTVRGARRLSENSLFIGALAVAMVHAVDDALLHRQPGVPVSQHLPALFAVALAAAVAGWSFGRLRPGLRSALALVSGSVVVANGAVHVIHVAAVRMEHSDLTGVLAAVAGLVLLGLGVRSRGGTATRSQARRHVGGAAAFSRSSGCSPAAARGRSCRDRPRPDPQVPRGDRRAARTGLRVGHLPIHRRAAAVRVVPPVDQRRGRRDRQQRPRRPLEVRRPRGAAGRPRLRGAALRRPGERAEPGHPERLGLGVGARRGGGLDFLQAQDGVDDHRIGGLGLSTGADVLIDVAANDPDLRAVVSDGATGRSFADRPPGTLNALFSAGMFGAGRLFGGTGPGEPLRELIAEAAPKPVLLVAAGSLPFELVANERYAEAGPSTTLWRLPEVTHTRAVVEVADEYERRVIEHFDVALLDRSR